MDAYDVNKLHVDNCKFHNNEHESIYISGRSKNSWVNGNFFTENDGNDVVYEYDATSDEVGRNIITENNFYNSGDRTLGNSISITGAADASVTDKFIVADNVIEGRSLVIAKVINVVINNNIIIGGTNIPLTASSMIKNLLVENNIIINNTGSIYAIQMTDDGTKTIQGTHIAGNTLENGGCHLINCREIVFANNKINQGTVTDNKGLYVEITAIPSSFSPSMSDYGNLLITNNQFMNIQYPGAGIQLSTLNASWGFLLICIDTNLIQSERCQYGIYIKSPTTGTNVYWSKALIGTSNIIGVADTAISVYGSYLIEQNPYQESWISNGKPEGLITAPQGSFVIDKTIEADNKYEKCSLDGSTGWQLLSEIYLQSLIRDTFVGTASSSIASHVPNQSVYSATWGVSPTSAWIFVTGSGTKPDTTATSPNLATYNSKPDGELKIIVKDNGSGSNDEAGILFRGNAATPSSYFKFYIKNNGSGTYELIIGTNSSTIHSCGTYTKTLSGRTVLKVIMVGDYFSFFYNDLNIYNYKDTTGSSSNAYHGLYAAGASTRGNFTCESLKMLIP